MIYLDYLAMKYHVWWADGSMPYLLPIIIIFEEHVYYMLYVGMYLMVMFSYVKSLYITYETMFSYLWKS